MHETNSSQAPPPVTLLASGVNAPRQRLHASVGAPVPCTHGVTACTHAGCAMLTNPAALTHGLQVDAWIHIICYRDTPSDATLLLTSLQSSTAGRTFPKCRSHSL